MNCPDCGHQVLRHFAGSDYVGCHDRVRPTRTKRRGSFNRMPPLTPCPCRRLDFPPDPPTTTSEQGVLL